MELHDAYTSSEIQTYEDMGLCRYGEGGPFAESGAPFMPELDYGLAFDEGRRTKDEGRRHATLTQTGASARAR